MDRPTIESVREEYAGYLKPEEIIEQYAIELGHYCDYMEEKHHSDLIDNEKMHRSRRVYEHALNMACHTLEDACEGVLYDGEYYLDWNEMKCAFINMANKEIGDIYAKRRDS